MKKAFFYDTLCGMVYRCMFAGIDELGHAQWVSITPGEESKTLNDVVVDEDLGDTRFILIGLEGETAPPEIIAKMLGKVMECPIDELGTDLAFAIRHMKKMGVKWDKEPMELMFRVFENRDLSQRKGKYSFWLENKKDICSILTDIDGFDDLNELFLWIRTFLLTMELTAEIPIITKDLRISDGLRLRAKKNDLGMFTSIMKEYDYMENKEEN
jgi:hypothetical protein